MELKGGWSISNDVFLLSRRFLVAPQYYCSTLISIVDSGLKASFKSQNREIKSRYKMRIEKKIQLTLEGELKSRTSKDLRDEFSKEKRSILKCTQYHCVNNICICSVNITRLRSQVRIKSLQKAKSNWLAQVESQKSQIEPDYETKKTLSWHTFVPLSTQ